MQTDRRPSSVFNTRVGELCTVGFTEEKRQGWTSSLGQLQCLLNKGNTHRLGSCKHAIYGQVQRLGPCESDRFPIGIHLQIEEGQKRGAINLKDSCLPWFKYGRARIHFSESLADYLGYSMLTNEPSVRLATTSAAWVGQADQLRAMTSYLVAWGPEA